MTEMMEVMPMVMPSSVRNERSLFVRKESKATEMYSRNPAYPRRSSFAVLLWALTCGVEVIAMLLNLVITVGFVPVNYPYDYQWRKVDMKRAARGSRLPLQ